MIVVADTSVVLNLSKVGRADLLPALFQAVWIPQEVARELARQASANPRFHGLQPPTWLQIQDPAEIPALIRSDSLPDPGEQAALALALELHADAILIDELNGRAMALRLGIPRVGILGILLQAKTSRLLPAIEPILADLENQAGFWISKSLRAQMLQLAGEAK